MRDDDQSARARAEAAAWIARLHADNRDRNDEAAFRAWLEASPKHGAAFEAADTIWSAAGGLSREEQLPNRLGRRAVMAGLGLLSVAGAGMIFWRPTSAQVFETGIGEQKHISLDDGSKLFLDAKTRLSAVFTRRTRRIGMHFGRANFTTVRDFERPFLVETGVRTIVSNNCTFEVRCDYNEIQVVALDGQAIVEPVAGADSFVAVTLRDGDRVIASNRDQRQDRPDLAALLSWHTGFETFDDDSLGYAAREMNRYSTVTLQVDPEIAGLKVSGVYRVGRNHEFAQSVSELLPIEVHHENNVILLTRKIDGWGVGKEPG